MGCWDTESITLESRPSYSNVSVACDALLKSPDKILLIVPLTLLVPPLKSNLNDELSSKANGNYFKDLCELKASQEICEDNTLDESLKEMVAGFPALNSETLAVSVVVIWHLKWS